MELHHFLIVVCTFGFLVWLALLKNDASIRALRARASFPVLPLIPLPGAVLFPGSGLTTHVRSESTLALVRAALEHGNLVGAITQRDADEQNPLTADRFFGV